ATGLPGYAANTTVNLGGVMAKYVKLTINANWGGVAPQTGLSEVRFSYVPVQAFGPQSANAATGVAIDTTLTWRPGREAGSHKVYFGADQAAVTNGTVAAKTVTDHSYTPGSLSFATTYYWRVDEVSTVSYPGDVWSFTTAAYGVVDDFESYNDKDNRIYDKWIDGLTDGKSGSQVGYDTAPFAEQTIVHGGTQSMPLRYDNTAKFAFSEAVRTFATAQDWTGSGIKSLSLYFQGAAANTGGQLYVKINSTKISYNGNASDLAKSVWTPWNIDLSSVGAGLSKVTSLTIGIEGAGSKGIVYLDDIRLYPKTPAYITPVDPGKANLVALYALDGNANDGSGKGNNGTVNGTGLWVPGKINQALQFNGTSTYVDCGSGASLNLTDAVTITAWVKMDFTGGDRKIAGNQDLVTGGYKFGVYTNNMAEFEIRTSANASTLNRNSAGGTALQQGVWYHVAGVYSKGQYIRTYVYGNLDRELVTTVLLGSSTGSFKLGRDPGSAAYYWLGAMDDVEVYNRALSQEEILWLSGQTTPVAKPF
ncbi:MAG: LamG domain-containing protein, partial [Phycisphaerae bacterium]|nr:LamG domain-containing protein [Phycisphaerae bacterium]